MKKIKLILAFQLVGISAFPQVFKLNFTPSPSAASNQVSSYLGVWAYTNGASIYTNNVGLLATNAATSNIWYVFGRAVPPATNLIIPSTVPGTAYVAVETVGTNGLTTAPTNVILYSYAAALAATSTNLPPLPPGPPAISQ